MEGVVVKWSRSHHVMAVKADYPGGTRGLPIEVDTQTGMAMSEKENMMFGS